MKNKLLTRLVLSSMALGLAVNQGRANPLGGTVAAGDATITGEGTTVTTIHQTSPTAIINWQDFSIGLGELTRFIQPGADAAVLNRVLSGSPSQLLGTLQANGQVYLINPNGIFVGPSGQINAATFVGSTLDVADGAFLSGGNMQFLGSTTAGVENLGTINALGGDIFLFGHTVKNSGTLNASGTAGLAAGMSIELRQQGNERIGVLLGNSAAPAETGVDNQGLVQATSVEINAAGGNIYAVAINNGGTVRAQSTLTMEGGKLVLKSVGGTVINSGTLDASNAGGKGGDIVVAGDKVSLRDGSVVNASGSTGGGSVKVGGGFQGNDASVVNASKTFVGTGASILADATTVGDGGTVIVWSDEVTRFGGSISAKGGALGGNGGFAEVSGKSLLFSGAVDLTAAAGEIGTLLLDPVQIQIAATDFNPVASNDEFAENAGLPAVFANTTINALLNGANVTLQANSDIYIDNAINAAGIGDLTLQAGRSVFINADVTLNGSFTATANDTAALAANRATTPFADGGITMGGTVTINTSSTGGNITLNVLTGAGGGFQSGDITVNNLNAGAGHVFLNNAGATAGSDVLMANGTALITAGSVALNAANGNIGSGATPVRMASTIVEASASGTVDIFATGALQIGGATLGSLTGITSGGALQVTAQGNITQTELITASAASTFTIDTANPADVLLASAANNFAGAITVNEANAGVVRDIAIRNVNASPAYPTFTIAGTIRNLTLIFDSADLTLPTTTITGNLVATSGTGLIAQSGTLTVPGTTTLNASTTITLNAAANDFTGAIASTSGGNTSLTDVNAIVLGASSVGGNLVVNAGTGITQTGVLTVTGTSSFTDAGADNDIVLTQANLFTGAVSATGNNVSITDANGLVLGSINAGNDLTVIATLGNITSDTSGTGIKVTGNSSFTASGTGVDIILDDTDNDFTGGVSIAGGTLANVTIFDSTALVLNAVTVTGNLTVTATGITQSGVITVGGVTTLDGNGAAIDLATQNNNFNSVTASDATNLSLNDINDIVLGAITLTGNLTVNSGLTGTGVTGNISQTGVLDINGTSAFNVSGADPSDILLASQANDFTGAISITEVGAGNIRDIEIRNVSATAAVPTFPTGLRNLTLIFNNTSIALGATTLTGTLTVTAGGDITDTGTLVVAGLTTLTAGANNIVLDDAANNFSSVNVVSGGNVTIVDVNAITFSASATLTSVAITGTAITLPSAITTTGAQTYTGAVLIGSDMTLSSTGGGNLTFSSTINSTSGNSFDLALVTDGSVSIGAAVGGVDHLDVLDIRADAITFTAITTDTSVTLRPFTAGTAIGVGDAGQTFNISNTELNNITSPSVTIGDSTAGAITAAVTESIGITYGITLVNNSSVTFGANTFSTTGALTVNANGAITDAAGATISVTGLASFTAGAANNITLGDNGGDTINFGTLTVNGNNVTITEDSQMNFAGTSTVAGDLAATTQVGGILIDASGSLAVTGNANFNSAGNINVGNNPSTTANFGTLTFSGATVTIVENSSTALTGSSSVSVNLNLVSDGDITDDATASLSVTGVAGFNADGNIVLGDTGTDSMNFGQLHIAQAVNATITEDSSTDLLGGFTHTITGNLILNSAGDITDAAGIVLAVTGNASFNANSGANNVTLGDNGGDTVNFGSLTVVGNNVTITEDSSTLLTGVNTVNGFLALTSGGAITDATGVTLNVTGNASFNATAALITLGDQGGDTVNFGSLTFNTTGGAVTITEDSDTVLTGISTADSLTLVSSATITDNAATSITIDAGSASFTGTAITLADNDGDVLSVSGTAIFNAGAGLINVGTGATTASTLFGKLTFNTTGGAVTITEDDATILTGTSTGDSLVLISAGSITDDSGTSVTIDNGNASFAGTAITLADNDGDVLSVSLVASFNSGAGSISLGQGSTANVGFGSLTLNGVNATVTEDSATDFTGSSVLTGFLTLVSNGAITDDANADLSVTGVASFTATSADITIGDNGPNNDDIFGSLTLNGANATVVEDDGTDFTGSSTLTGNLTLTSAGAITDQSGVTIAVTGTASFNAGAANITLGDNGGDTIHFGKLLFNTTAGAVTITEDSATIITGPFNTADSLTLISAGSITDDSGVSIVVDVGNASFTATSIQLADDNGDVLNVAGTASFDGGAGTVVVGVGGTANTTFGKLNFNSTSSGVTVFEDDATVLTGINTGDSLLITSAGSITDDPNTSVTIDAGNATLTATSISLTDNATDVFSVANGVSILNTTSGPGDITLAAAGTVTLGGITLNGVNATIFADSAASFIGSSTLTGFLSLTTAGDIQDFGPVTISVTGIASFSAVGGQITLGDEASDVVNFGSLTVNGLTANITEDSSTDFTGSSVLAGFLTLVSNGAITDDANADISVGGTASFTATGADITLGDNGANNDDSFAQLTLNGVNATVTEDDSTDFTGASVLSGNLTLVSNGAITDDANADISVTGIANFTATAADITLGDQAGNVDNFSQLTLNAVNATVTEDSGTDFAGSSALTGFLTLTSAGDITDDATADINVTGVASFTATASSITLGDQAGNDDNFGQLTLNGVNATVTEDDGTDFTGSSTLTGFLTLVSNGAITDDANADLAITGTASFTATASSITLGDQAGNATDFGSLTVNGVNATVTEDSGTVFTGASVLTGFLTLTSAGDITDDATADLSVTGIASLTATASSITLGDAVANDLFFGQLTVNGVNATITEDNGTDFTGSSVLTGFLALISNGAITDDADADIDVTGNASLNAGANAITIGDNGANNVDNFGSVTLSGTVVAVTEDSAMTVAGATATTSLTLSAFGTVDQSTAPIVTPTLSVTVTTAGPDDADILLLTQDNDVSGAVTFAEANADALRDVLWRNVSATATWPTLPATVTINDLTVQHTMAGINITADLTLKDIAGPDSGDLNLLAGGGAITQNAGVELLIPGDTTLSASGNIVLTQANDFDQTVNGTTSLVAGDGVVTILDGVSVSITDINDIIIDASDATTATGASVATLTDLTINAGGTIFVEDNNQSTSTPVTITTTSFQAYNGNVVLEQDTIMNSTASGTISFSGTINSDAIATPRSLEVNTAGLTQFSGSNVGDIAPLSSLTTDSVASGILGGNTELTGTFVTTVSQLHRDAVILKSDVVINTTTATFDSTVDGDGVSNGDFGLTINDTAGTGSATTATFNGAVGTASATSALDFLTVNATSINLNGGAVTTSDDTAGTGNQLYNGAVVINATGDATTLTGVDITFQSTVRSLTDGEEALTVSGTGITTFNGAVGDNSQRLASLTSNNGGTTRVNGGIVNTTGLQLFNDDVTIGAGVAGATTFTSAVTAGNLGIHFVGRVDDDGTAAESNVSLVTQGIGQFDSLVGDITPLTSLTTDAGGETHINPAGGVSGSNADANVYTTGNQTYNDDVKLSVDLAANNGLDVYLKADAGSTIAFGPRVDGRDDFEQGLTVFADSVSITTTQVGILVPLEFLDISAGPSGITTSSLTQNTEIQFLVGTAILGIVEANGFNLTITANDINFVGGAGSIRPGAPLGGAGTVGPSLTLRPISTSVAMNIGVSADVPATFSLSDADLLALADGFGGITIGRFDGANPITVSSSNFTDPVRIQAPLAGGTMLIDGLVQSTATPQEALLARDLFLTDIDQNNNPVFINSYVLGEGGNITGSAGTPLPNGAGILLFGPGSTVTMNANIQTAGTPIVINDGVILNTDVSLNTTFNGVAAGNDITITGTINSAALNNFGITLRGGTGGNIDIQNTVGNAQALSDIIIPNANNVDFDNTVNISGAITITTANDVIFRNTVVAGGSISIASANNVNFENTVAAASVTQAAGTGVTLFRDNVTTTTATGVNITSAGITLDGLTIDSTAGNGAIRLNGPVTLSTADVTLSSGTGNITFENTVNGGVNLALNSTAFTTFNGLVGTGTALTSVTTDAGGTTVINGAGVTTTADQLYNDNVNLGVAAVTLNGVNVTFNGTLDGPAALQVNASGVTTFGDAAGDSVGAGTALLSLTTDAAGSTTVNAAIVTTSGQQIYNDAVTFNTDINFTGSTVTFNQALAGAANNLTVTGNAVFGDAAADSVNTGAILVTGNTTVNAATVNTGAESQTYNGDVTLNTDVNFTGSTVQFDEDILGTPNNLTITGSAIFGNASNDAVNTGAILVTGATLVNSGTVTTTGETQIYTGNVGLGNSVNFTGTTVNFLEDVIGGANNLTVTGDATFGDAADDIIGANQITVTGATSITAGAVNSTTSQIYGGAITLAGSTVLTAGTDVTFNSTINGAFNMTVSAAGVTRFNGTVGNTTDLGILIVNGGGTAVINTPQIDALAVQFDDAVILAADTTVTGTSSIRFNSTITGANFDLTTVVGAAFTQFNGDVTGVDVLNTTGTATFINTALISGNVLNFDDAIGIDAANVQLVGQTSVDFALTIGSTGLGGAEAGNNLTINSPVVGFHGAVSPSGALADLLGTLTVDGTTAGAGTTTIDIGAAGGNGNHIAATIINFNQGVVVDQSAAVLGVTSVSFNSIVNSAASEANNLTVNSPVTLFAGVVGGVVNGALGTLSTDAAGTTTIDTTAITAAVVDFNDAIVLNQSVVVTGTTSVDFLSTINSQAAEANSLTVNSPVTGFHGIIGALVPLGTLSTDAAGTTTLDTTAITAAVVDFNDAVLVDQNLTINGTTSIDFAGTLDSQAAENNDLTLNSPVTGFHGIVGGTRPLGTLNTDAAGTTTLDTTAISVAVADFNDAVVVDQNLTIIGTTSIDFAGTLNSQVLENNDLTLNSPTTGFHGIVGAASPFGTLSTDAAGTTTIDTTAVTAANVDFNDAILLTQDVVINGTATIDFASTVNSSGGARDLTLNSPTTAFHGVVGGNAALDVLSTDAAGTTTIDTTAITAAVVDFNDAILLTQDVVINGSTSIDFASTVNSSGGARDLTLNSPVTGFHGVVGGSAVLDVLTTDAAGTTTIDTTAINAAVIDFNDAIIIDVGTVLTGTTSVDFALTVNSQVGEANDLTVNSPTTGFHGIVGGTTPLNTLTTDAAGTTTIDTTAITADVVDFNDAILLSQDVVITGVTSVDFASTVNSSGAARDLTVNSPTTAFHGIVGGTSPLDVLTTDAAGTTTIDTTAITGATLDFNDAVTLSQNVVLTGTTTVDFATTVNSDLIATPRTLLVVSPLTIFGGSVGGAVPLASLTTDASGGANLTRINGGSVTTTGDQLYNDTVRLGADTILTGNDITFATLLDSSEGALRSLTVNSTGGGITTFNGAVGTLDRLAHLETNADGRTDIAGGLINLNGASALFNDPVLLLADLTINEAGVGSVTFNNTLNGAFNLVVNSDGLGATIFNGVVGGVTPLASITTDADGTTQINGGIVNTSGFQLYNDPVTIGANTVLTSTGVGAAGNITFVTTLDGPFTLLVNTAGTTTFGGPVGSITPLNSVTTDAPGATAINGGSVLTFGIQTYNDPVTLGANTIITSTGAAALGNVTFNSTLDSAVGPFSLIVNTAGNTDFNGAVGGVGALLSLTTDAPGTVSIDGGAVTTTTFQLYNDVATIGANTVLASTGAGNITFMQTLDGAFTLNVNTAGITIFNGVVGGITPLVSVVTDAPGSTQVNGTAVTTSGIQTYNDPVTVGANTLFTSTGVGAAGNITFNSTLDDDAVVGAANVTVNTAGATTFNGAVGGITPLTSLTTDAAGNVAINGGLVTTVNNQTYNDVATLGADTVLNSLAAGNITFAQTLDDDLTIPANTSNLIVNTSGVTTFGGVVGGISPLTSITTDPAVGVVGAGDITAINGGLVITTGFQTYNDNVTVNQDTTLTSTTAGNITIGQPNPPVPWGLTTLMGTVPGVDMIINALGGNVQINAAVSGVDTLNGIATATYIAANPGNTGINLYLSTPNSPFVFIYTAPPVSFNLNNKVYSMEEIFGRDVPNLFKYPGDDKSVSSEITVLLTTNKVETLIGSLPTDKITTSYDLAALEEARKNR